MAARMDARAGTYEDDAVGGRVEEEVEDVAFCSALLQVCELELLDTTVEQ